MGFMHSGRVTKLVFGLQSAVESKHQNKIILYSWGSCGGKVGIYICAALTKV